MENAVTPRAAAGIGRAWLGGQARIVDRVVLALVADTPVADAALQDSRGAHEFDNMECTPRGELAEQ
jgi:hypothetical protein